MDTMVGGTKGWFSHIRARRVSKNKATCGFWVAATTGKAHGGKERSWQGKSPELFRRGNDHRWDGLGSQAGRKPLTPPSNVFACPVHDSRQPFLGFGSVLLLRYSTPHTQEDTKEEPLERWDHQGGRATRGEAGWESERTCCHTRLPSGLAESYKRL